MLAAQGIFPHPLGTNQVDPPLIFQMGPPTEPQQRRDTASDSAHGNQSAPPCASGSDSDWDDLIPAACHPLPVSDIVGHLGISEPEREMDYSLSPVVTQGLCEIRRSNEPRAIVLETLEDKLSHSRYRREQPQSRRASSCPARQDLHAIDGHSGDGQISRATAHRATTHDKSRASKVGSKRQLRYHSPPRERAPQRLGLRWSQNADVH